MSDFLERNGLQTVAQHFKDLFLASVHRDGAEELLERLENETDFFEAPAGAKHHGAFPGGLVIHSLNVYYPRPDERGRAGACHPLRAGGGNRGDPGAAA